jgi:hypothetical protein
MLRIAVIPREVKPYGFKKETNSGDVPQNIPARIINKRALSFIKNPDQLPYLYAYHSTQIPESQPGQK